MKVAYFTESLLPLVDGVSLTLARLFGTLERADVEFLIFSPFVPGADLSWAGRVRRVRSVCFPLYPDYRVSLPFSRRVRRELDSFQPDLIHVVSPTPMAVWAQRLAKRRGIPVVSSFHTDFVSYFRHYRMGGLEPLGWRGLRWFYNRCAATFAPAESVVRALGEQGIRGAESWSRGIDARRFSPDLRDEALRASWGAAPEVPVLLFVGRLVREKDLLEFEAITRRLRERELEFRLVLVGDGPLLEELERALPEARFAGYRDGDDLARHFASADLFLFPSTTETFGNVVVEAAASGVPAVVAGRGGPPDLIVPGETGLIARANDPTDFAACVAGLLGNRERLSAMGRSARSLAVERDWERINLRLIERYRELAATHA
jgi:phosphatidylinositol alpha 1,6-mannosyltransferase